VFLELCSSLYIRLLNNIANYPHLQLHDLGEFIREEVPIRFLNNQLKIYLKTFRASCSVKKNPRFLPPSIKQILAMS
jgi:hypothetical protein